jgi:hypothetical protein
VGTKPILLPFCWQNAGAAVFFLVVKCFNASLNYKNWVKVCIDAKIPKLLVQFVDSSYIMLIFAHSNFLGKSLHILNTDLEMGKSKLLFITHEMSPFLELTKIAEITRQLPQAMQEKGYEIRILMPRFGNINERRNRLHEVIRLSGMNIIINDNDNPLIIKVASIPAARMQVYFLDNEEYFQRKHVFE